MKINSISFGNVFSNRKLRFESDSVTDSVNFGGIKDPFVKTNVKYGIPKPPKKNEDNIPDAPMVRYAIPENPEKADSFVILPDEIKPSKKTTAPKVYVRYAIPGHFND